MNLETLQVFGLSCALVIYMLVERAAMVRLLPTPAAKFLAPGLLALAITVLAAISQEQKPPAYMVLITWLGLWVAAMMVKSTVKDGGPKPPDRPAV